MSKAERYQIVSISILGHYCCFDHTIFDTSIENNHTDTKVVTPNQVVCECKGEETANYICDALNNQEGG